MKIYLSQNVLEAALARIRRLYREFPQVIVNFSGGKDSTVVLNLALQVAAEEGRLPVDVLFLDQEAEWQTVIDYIRTVMNDPRVRPWWFQGPFRIFNATSGTQQWLHAWEEGGAWIRPKEPNSIHENVVGTDRFHELFDAFSRHYFGGTPCAHIGGVRCEESPARQKGLTCYPCYKDITWGNARGGKASRHYAFYPLYDWAWTDVWKAIHDHGWPYCRLYDYMFNYGIPARNMRVSNVHHETAVDSLRFLQEIEPDTWNKILDRVQGVNAVSKVREAYVGPSELPFMFASWKEYRDYLMENLVEDEATKAKWRVQFRYWDNRFLPEIEPDTTKASLSALLVNDYHGTKLSVFMASHGQYLKGAGKHRDQFSTASNRADGYRGSVAVRRRNGNGVAGGAGERRAPGVPDGAGGGAGVDQGLAGGGAVRQA